jgi:DNA-binding CsgD family transcriptional regulator
LTTIESISNHMPLIGRERERALLGRLLADAAEGRGAFVLIGGDAGIGKTRLCEEIARDACAAGFLSLAGHCLEGGAPVPYLPFVEVLEAAADAMPPDAFRAALGESAAQLAVLAPGVRDVVRDIPQLAPSSAEHQRQEIFGAARDFFDRASRARPLAVFVEDVHWAGEATLLLLRYLVQFVTRRRILVVGTYRPGEQRAPDGAGATGGFERLVEQLHRSHSAELVHLPELVRSDVDLMVRALVQEEAPPEALDWIYEQAGGNPLFIEQVVKHLAEEGALVGERPPWRALGADERRAVPESVRIVIERRLQRVDETCRRVLGVAAVIGRAVDEALLAAICGESSGALADAVEQAEEARLLVRERDVAAGRLSFAHDLIRQAILSRMPASQRQDLHLRVARAIEAAPGVRDRIPQLAHHALLAGSAADAARTTEHLRAAAEQAMAATAYEAAARWYREMLRLLPAEDVAARCEAQLCAAEAQKRVSDSDAARDAFGGAAVLARESGDAGQLARAALGFARSWPTIGAVDATAIQLLRDALDAIGPRDGVRRAALTARLALQLVYSGRPEEVKELAREAVAIARRSHDAIAEARALQVLHAALWQPHHLEERLAAATAILPLAERAGDRSVALWGQRPRIADLLELGDVEAVEAEVAAYEQGAALSRQPIYRWQAAVRLAMLAIFHGHFDEGERLAQRALEIGRQAEGQNLIAAFGGQLLVVRWQQGRLGELEGLIRASRQNQPQASIWLAALAFTACETGRPDEARTEFAELARDDFAAIPDDDTSLTALVLASLVCGALADAESAADLYGRLLPYDGRNIVVSEGVACVGAAAHYLGMLAAAARRWDDAERHFTQAAAMNERTGGRPWLAHAYHEHARMLLARRRPGDRAHAVQLLRMALGIARDLGMRGLQTAVEQRLRSWKAPPDERGLTRRELEVLRLIAAGRSTKEISDELVLSVRTTARHITNIYAKIGARNRADATAYALRRDSPAG